MDTVTTILGGLVIAMVSGAVGKSLGISKTECNLIREGCRNLLLEKLETVIKDIKEIKEIVNDKLLGL